MADQELRVRHGTITFEDQGGLEVTGDGKARLAPEELETFLRVRVFNDTGVGLADNALVYVSAHYVPAAGGATVRSVALADANSATVHPAQYIVDGAIANQAYGYVKKYKDIDSVNTGATVDAAVYLSETAGGWTLTLPTGAATIPQVVGRVKTANAVTGRISFALAGDMIVPHNHSGVPQGGGIGSSALTFEPMINVGSPAVGYLRLTGAVADGETLVINGRTYEFDTAADPGAVGAGSVRVNVSAGDVTADAAVVALVAAISGDASAVVDARPAVNNADANSVCQLIERPGTTGIPLGTNYTLVTTCVNGTVSGAAMVQAVLAADQFHTSGQYLVTAADVTEWTAAGGGAASHFIGALAVDGATQPIITSILVQDTNGVIKSPATIRVAPIRVNTNWWGILCFDAGAVMANTDSITWTVRV